MKLSASSSQSELRALYVRVTRDEFLRDTPLNLRMFLRYALLFVLFPSMVFGFRIGLTVMAGFCGGMIVCMLAGKYDLAHAAVVCWLLFGAVVLLVVAGSTLITARKRLRKRRTPRPADAPLPSRGAEPISPGDTRELLWTPGDTPRVFTSSLELHVTHPGIWAITVEIRDCGHSKLMLPDSCGLCPLHSGNQGQELRSVVLCWLESGIQHIPWILVSNLPHPPRATAGILCMPHAE